MSANGYFHSLWMCSFHTKGCVHNFPALLNHSCWLQPEFWLSEEYRIIWLTAVKVCPAESWAVWCILWSWDKLIHAWFVLPKLQNSLLLLETPADLASAVDPAFIARHEELHNATSRTVCIITIHCVIFSLVDMLQYRFSGSSDFIWPAASSFVVVG